MEKNQEEKFVLKKGTKFLELTEFKQISNKAYKDIEITSLQKKCGNTYFRLGNKICKLVSIFLFITLFFGHNSFASEKITDENATLAIIGEAENQGYDGMLYVGCGIRNRGTLRGVYGLRNPRVVKKLYSKRIKEQATQAWKESETSPKCDNLKGAQLWENVNAFGKPNWDFSKLTKTFEHKDHMFFFERK